MENNSKINKENSTLKKQKVIVLRGIPASGKSTWALEYIKKNNRTIIVNRDSLRNMCGEYWVPSREPLITEMEEFIVKKAIEMGYDVIIDATHIKEKYINKWKKFVTEDMEFVVKTFTISKWLAYYRDWKRGLFGGHRVGKKVIDRFYNELNKN